MYSYSILREPLLGFMCNTLNSGAENPKETQWQVGMGLYRQEYLTTATPRTWFMKWIYLYQIYKVNISILDL